MCVCTCVCVCIPNGGIIRTVGLKWNLSVYLIQNGGIINYFVNNCVSVADMSGAEGRVTSDHNI